MRCQNIYFGATQCQNPSHSDKFFLKAHVYVCAFNYSCPWDCAETFIKQFHPNLCVCVCVCVCLYVCVGGGGIPSRWFSLNNSKTVKAVTMVFCSTQLHSIKDIRAKFDIHNLTQSSDIGQNSDANISDFRIFGQSLKKNCHNSRIITKLGERNKKSSKNFSDDVMSENCDVIVNFRIFGQFRAVRIL